MLTQSVMIVVFVHREKITYGSFLTNGGKILSLLDMVNFHKVPQ